MKNIKDLFKMIIEQTLFLYVSSKIIIFLLHLKNKIKISIFKVERYLLKSLSKMIKSKRYKKIGKSLYFFESAKISFFGDSVNLIP